ncbi:retropepsin-like domain-containing protein [archaeon]|nr:retropepsin-like domain-containing protein [archaeon]
MRIPLKFVDGRLILVTKVRTKRAFGSIDFHIDTGSTISFIGASDAARLQISAGALPVKQTAKIGGGSLGLHELSNVALYCRDEQGQSVSLLQEQPLLVASSLRKGPEATIEALSFPSLIGTKFLAEHKLALYFAPAENIAYLENKDN